MKKLITLILLLLLLALPVNAQEYARMNVGIVAGSGGAAAAKSCAVDSVAWIDNLPDQDVNWNVANATGVTYVGQGHLDPGVNKTICEVRFDIRNTIDGGGLAAIEWVVEIYAMNGTALGSAPTGTCVSGHQHITGAAVVAFTGLNCSLTNGTEYAFVLTRADHSYDANNYINIHAGSSDVIAGNFGSWTNLKAAEDNLATYEASIEIWGFTP